MNYKLNEYPLELPLKELDYTRIDEDILYRSALTLSDEERIQLETAVNHGRRDLVQTENGIVKTAWHRSKNIDDTEFQDHVINILAPEFQTTDDIKVKQQWIWGSPTITPHVDWGREQFLMYILDTGGENVTTNFYIEPGYPLYRKWIPFLSKIEDTRQLIKVYTATLKPKTWYYMNANIIHDVVGMTSPRIAISVQQGVWTPSTQ